MSPDDYGLGYHIEFLPEFKTGSNKSAGNGGTLGRQPGHHQRKFNDRGIYYMDGIGCRRHDNCFTCPFPPNCKFQSGYDGEDLKFIANPGNGIKVW